MCAGLDAKQRLQNCVRYWCVQNEFAEAGNLEGDTEENRGEHVVRFCRQVGNVDRVTGWRESQDPVRIDPLGRQD